MLLKTSKSSAIFDLCSPFFASTIQDISPKKIKAAPDHSNEQPWRGQCLEQESSNRCYFFGASVLSSPFFFLPPFFLPSFLSVLGASCPNAKLAVPRISERPSIRLMIFFIGFKSPWLFGDFAAVTIDHCKPT